MQPSPQRDKIFLALCANGIVLVLILLVLASRGNQLNFASTAMAQSVLVPAPQPPIAGGNGLYVMPAQLSPNTWGCYVMDVDNQTLCVYNYSAGEKLLRLAAARNFKYDRRLGNFNTAPPPAEIKDLADRENDPRATLPSPSPKSPEAIKPQ